MIDEITGSAICWAGVISSVGDTFKRQELEFLVHPSGEAGELPVSAQLTVTRSWEHRDGHVLTELLPEDHTPGDRIRRSVPQG